MTNQLILGSNLLTQYTDILSEVEINVEFPTVFQPIFRPARYKVFYGGRGSAKSWNFARALLILAAAQPLRILCTREFQVSIKDSVHRLLADQIVLLGLEDEYDVTNSEIRSLVGSVFIFKGLRHNVEDIKSLEGVDICWVEEAEKTSALSWKILPPTIRKAGSEIWVSYNPDQETDPTHQRFVVNKSDLFAEYPNAIIQKVSYRDNPFFPEELRKEMNYDRKVDPQAAAWIWDGEFNVKNNAAVFGGKCRIDVFEPQPDWDGPYHGADWGFAQDPTVLIRCWISGKKLYIERELYAIGVETVDVPNFFDRMPLARNYRILADNARPETISHVSKNGYKIFPAEKGPGSVEDGIAFIRSFEEIVIHERCKHTIQESSLYRHKIDKLTGDILPDLVDKHNHCWDSIRYALNKMVMISKKSGRPSIRSL